MNWTMSMSVPVELGTGSFERLIKYLYGVGKILVMTGRHGMKATGVTDRLCDLLENAGVECLVYDKVSAEPNFEEVEEAATLAQEFGAEIIVGCGGGSALDAAKAAAVAATHPIAWAGMELD